jgi:two-component system nitrogen regulation sensor histidine kinase NtrY
MRLLPRMSRVEQVFLLAIAAAAAVPLLTSLVFMPLFVEAAIAPTFHARALEQLEGAAVLYKDFFDARKREYAARAESFARDPVLLHAAEQRRLDDVRARMEQTVADNRDVAGIRLLSPDGAVLAEALGPKERRGDDQLPKTFVHLIGLGEAPRLEVTFVLARSYLEAKEHAEEVMNIYETALRTSESRAQAYQYTWLSFILIAGLVALLVGWSLARSAARRLAQLAGATARVAKGERGFSVPALGNDEITELTRAFNRMIEEVAEARDRLVYLEKVSGWQEFARRLAHEIKNPLTPLRLGFQELRRRAPDSDPAFKRLMENMGEVVEEEIGALTRLVDQFSQFARLPDVQPVPVEVRRFLLAFLEAYHRFEPEAVVELELPEAPVVARLDRVLMRRVLVNLVTNGIQAAQKGQARIRLSLEAKGDAVELRVEDNGPGVPPELGERIFEPYYTTKSEGTGLGLAIVKKLVLQHDGTITLGRGRDGGAAFTLTLPRAPEGEVPDEGDDPPLPDRPPPE